MGKNFRDQEFIFNEGKVVLKYKLNLEKVDIFLLVFFRFYSIFSFRIQYDIHVDFKANNWYFIFEPNSNKRLFAKIWVIPLTPLHQSMTFDSCPNDEMKNYDLFYDFYDK